jgi:hypothetical protein
VGWYAGGGDSCEAGHPFPAGQLRIREARAGEKQSNEKRAAAFVGWGGGASLGKGEEYCSCAPFLSSLLPPSSPTFFSPIYSSSFLERRRESGVASKEAALFLLLSKKEEEK